MNLDEHWYVLLTIRSKEEEVCKYLNENEGIFAFSPKMEFYHRVSKQIQQRTLFGGYVFVVSKLSQVEVDRIFRKFPLESVFIHELKYKEDISALTDEEIRMSYGVLLNNKIHVTRGPLVNMDDYIIISNNKDKLKKALNEIEYILNKKYKLNINKNETNIYDSYHGFEYLGYMFYIRNNKTIIKIKSSNKRRRDNNIKKINYLYKNNCISYQKYFNSMNNYNNSYKYIK